MAIQGDTHIRLTHEVETLLAELGGVDPHRVLRRDELARALVNAIEILEASDPRLLASFSDRVLALLTPAELERLSRRADEELGLEGTGSRDEDATD